MRLTRRGWTVAGVVVAAIGSGLLFGPRGLNAVAAPGVVALVAAAVQVRRLDQPGLEREVPPTGQRGDAVRIRLRFDADTPFNARVIDTIDDGLVATDNVRETTVTDGTMTYDLRLEARGEREVGPAFVEAQDVLGLVEERFRYPVRHTILVRPRVYLLAGPRHDDLVMLYGGASDDRQQFDHLRLYRRGDPVRDIHWKSSAKQPGDDLVVKEFATDEGSRTVEIAANGVAGGGDAMADATASIAVDLLEAGVGVGVTTPTGRIEPDVGLEHRERILNHLATVNPGVLPDRARSRADILVEGRPGGATVDLSGRACDFADLAGTDLDGTTARSGDAASTDDSPTAGVTA